MNHLRATEAIMGEAPGRVAPADRQWGWCRRITPELANLLERKGVYIPKCDHVVVLKFDARSVILTYWRGTEPVGYVNAAASVGRDVARLGAPERV